MLERLRVKQKYRELGIASGESDEGGAKTGEGECEIASRYGVSKSLGLKGTALGMLSIIL